MLREFCTPQEFSEALGLTPDHVRRMCENGELPYAEKVGSRWYINSDLALGKAAPRRAQPVVDEDALAERVAERIASRLLQALSTGFAGISTTTQSYHR